MFDSLGLKEVLAMEGKIYLSSPHMSNEGYEQKYIKQAFDTNWISSLGENLDVFETDLAKYVGSKTAVALSSGTAAIHMALKAVGVEEGDIVFCQSLTFAATANPIIYQKATPVFIDSDYETWNMSPEALELAFKKYPKVKAVLLVHLYGLAANLDDILALCKKYDVPLIEDAAESLGTKYKGKYTGTFGEFGIFSFNGNKIITTSGGGMLISDNFQKVDKVRFWSTQSRETARHYQHNELGYNYRMSNVLAGIGRGQLKVLDQRIARKREIFQFYKCELDALEGLEFMPINDWNTPNCWLTCITINGFLDPLDIIEVLEKNNIEARPIWKPMHLQPFFKKYDMIGGEVSENLFAQGVCLPSDTNMSSKDLTRIISIIKGLWE